MILIQTLLYLLSIIAITIQLGIVHCTWSSLVFPFLYYNHQLSLSLSLSLSLLPQTTLQEVNQHNSVLLQDIVHEKKQSQLRTKDLEKDIEVLRSENSHLSKALSSMEEERDNARHHKADLQRKLSLCETKLSEVWTMYLLLFYFYMYMYIYLHVHVYVLSKHLSIQLLSLSLS